MKNRLIFLLRFINYLKTIVIENQKSMQEKLKLMKQPDSIICKFHYPEARWLMDIFPYIINREECRC
jgi:hypothetical protein